MRIMLFPGAYAPHKGGVEELTYRLVDEYRRQGHKVLVVTARWPLSLPAYEVINRIEVRRIDYVMPNRSWRGLLRFLFWFPWRLLGLAQIIKSFKPDVVHIQCVSVQGFYLLLLKKLLRFRLIVTLQGERRMDAARIYQTSRLMEPMLKRLLHTADYVTACSKATLDDVLDLGLDQSKSAVIPNGISLDEFETVADLETILPPQPYIFATGRQVYNKGFDWLIEAFSQVSAIYPGIDLVIGGDGPEHVALQEQVTRLGLADRVHLPGSLDRQQTVTYFRHCLFFILPSRYEPFGIVNLEAMAAGKAVIAADVGGVREVVEHTVSGLLIPGENQVALAEAMRKLLDNLEQAEAMGQVGRTRVRTEFNWSTIAKIYLATYIKIIAL